MTWSVLSINEFQKYRHQWQSLNLNGPNSPLLDPRFIGPLLKYFPADNVLLAIYGEPNNPGAMAILRKAHIGSWNTYQPSQAPIGPWIISNNLNLDVLVPKLIRTLPGYCLNLGITQQDPDLLSRPENTICASTLDYIKTARITIDRSFNDYWSQRGKNLRHNIKRQHNRLKKEGIERRLVKIEDPSLVTQAIDDYSKLESAGWKNNLGTSIQSNNNQGKYYKEILESFCNTNTGLIYQYYYNNDLVASDLCIHNNETIIILKTTYDENQKTSSPSMLMRYDAFSEIFNEEHFKYIEFYGKVMEWHTRWSDEIRQMYHINCSRLPFIPKIKSFLNKL